MCPKAVLRIRPVRTKRVRILSLYLWIRPIHKIRTRMLWIEKKRGSGSTTLVAQRILVLDVYVTGLLMCPCIPGVEKQGVRGK